nr:F-box/LRR-repeat protein At4g14103-like [Coffea arabica]
MMMKSTPGSDVGSVDRISALPDPLICHILSFLPLKESAATSVLSTRWKFLFASLADIDLQFKSTYRPNVRKSVLEFIDSQRLIKFLYLAWRILQFRDGVPITKLTLSVFWIYEMVDKKFRSLIDSWISAALLFNVQELKIFVSIRHYAINCPGIFACKTLVSLRLLVVSTEVPSLVVLPNLKVLHMSLKGQVVDSVRRLIQGCPLLEELDVALDLQSVKDEETNDAEADVVDFSGPSIKRLRIELWGGDCTVLVDSGVLEHLAYGAPRHDGEHQVIFNVPNLTHLSYSAPAIGVNFIQNLNSLVEASIGAGLCKDQLNSRDAIVHLIRVKTVKSLSLGQDFLEALYDSQDFLPIFKNLTSLTLVGSCYPDETDHILSWKALASLFGKAPSLEALTFSKVCLGNVIENEELECLFSEALPICFIKLLKEIEFKFLYKEEEECQLKLIEYLLKNGKALKKMTVGHLLMPSVCRRILLFKRGSEDCEIILDEAKKYFGDICGDLQETSRKG